MRLHLKKSRVPSAILKLLPRGLAGPGGASQSFILEKSTVDLKEGWMKAESKNMEWTGILSVIERQEFLRQHSEAQKTALLKSSAPESGRDWTSCKTTVTFVSKLGQARTARRKQNVGEVPEQQEAPKQGFFAALSTAGIQRTVELVGVKRTKTALVNGKEGMNVVLERLREGGILAVLEGMRRDRLESMGIEDRWKKVWMNGGSDDNGSSKHDPD